MKDACVISKKKRSTSQEMLKRSMMAEPFEKTVCHRRRVIREKNCSSHAKLSEYLSQGPHERDSFGSLGGVASLG